VTKSAQETTTARSDQHPGALVAKLLRTQVGEGRLDCVTPLHRARAHEALRATKKEGQSLTAWRFAARGWLIERGFTRVQERRIEDALEDIL
jgi:hypothetical protein